MAHIRGQVGQKDQATLLLLSTREASFNELGAKIALAYQQRREAKRSPLVITILLESFRPSETSMYAGSAEKQKLELTPNIRNLASKGIWYPNAYGVGSVTRAGQEAVNCGFASSLYNSLMREQTSRRWFCLSDLLSQTGVPFWFHGGEGRFDNQLTFWQRHGIELLLTWDDFTGLPKGGWGIGDRSLLLRSAEELGNLRQQSTGKPVIGTVLTVSNHIPWELPKDAQLDPIFRQTFRGEDRKFLLTAYTDQAVGEFVQTLKAKGLWDDTLLILASDHGSRVDPITVCMKATTNLCRI